MNQAEVLDFQVMRESVTSASNLMKVFANTDRLLLLCKLSQHELCVSELEEMLDIRQPTLSQQLTVLRDEGLVATRRDGKRIYYSISSVPAMAVLQVLYQQFCLSEKPDSNQNALI
ncbi:MAG: helix-turn-helix transcriptional regulator [Methylophilaceae bacterium]|nr:helix-turn-helix transcriptional regulator [Methylophilaceae bacterium]